MHFNRYATIEDTWACGRFVYVRFVTVFRYNSCLCTTVISVDWVLATKLTHASIVHSHAKWQMMTAVLRVWLRNCRLITSFYCFTLLVLHIPVLFLWSFIFRSCIFRCWYLVLHFQVLHFQVFYLFWSPIFRSCIFSRPTGLSFVKRAKTVWLSIFVLSCTPSEQKVGYKKFSAHFATLKFVAPSVIGGYYLLSNYATDN